MIGTALAHWPAASGRKPGSSRYAALTFICSARSCAVVAPVATNALSVTDAPTVITLPASRSLSSSSECFFTPAVAEVSVEHRGEARLVLWQVKDAVAQPDEEAHLARLEIRLLDVQSHIVGEPDGADAEVGDLLVLRDRARLAEAVVGEGLLAALSVGAATATAAARGESRGELLRRNILLGADVNQAARFRSITHGRRR